MALEVKRLQLAKLRGLDGTQWPVHGFVVNHPGGAVLVDTGVGGPDEILSDWRVVNRSAADALAELDMTPGDIGLVINTHLHFDHCGQNAVFPHAEFYVQRTELARCQREAPELYSWFDFMNARFELLDGDAEVLDLPDSVEPLVDYFRSISGEHPDWEEYRQAMVRQGKSLLRVTPVRWGPVATGGFPPRLA